MSDFLIENFQNLHDRFFDAGRRKHPDKIHQIEIARTLWQALAESSISIRAAIGPAAALCGHVPSHARLEKMVRIDAEKFGSAIPILHGEFPIRSLIQNVRDPRIGGFIALAFPSHEPRKIPLALAAMFEESLQIPLQQDV